MPTIMKKLTGNRNGATAIEYGLIAGLVALAIVTVLTTTGGNLSTLFGNANGAISTASTVH